MKKLILLLSIAFVSFSTHAQVTSLVENFDTCDSTTGGWHPTVGWSAYSVIGDQEWWWNYHYGVSTNSPCMQMNGYAASGDHANEDWLITPKMNLSAMSYPVFNFYALYKYAGDTLHIMVSNNYGGGNPDSSVYTWHQLSLDRAMIDDTDGVNFVFRRFRADLTPYKSNPMSVAFKYTSSNSDGSRWSVDSVFTTDGPKLAVADVNQSAHASLTVLGDAQSNRVNLSFNTAEAGTYILSIYDMPGRMVYKKEVIATEGTNNLTIDGINLGTGMYILNVQNTSGVGRAKFIVK